MLRIIFSLFFAFIACFFVNCDAQSGKRMSKEERKMEAMLKEFYTVYITTIDKGPVHAPDSILKEYSTAELLKEIEDKNKDDYVLDFDPFINAQDASVKWLETFFITKDTLLKNTFIITMKDNYTSVKEEKDKPIVIKVTVVKDGDVYKIGDILEPDWRKYKNQL